VDEIHERGMYEDFLLIILKDLLPRRPDLRLILMSATINAELFSQYFGNAPTIDIPVQCMQIHLIYEDLLCIIDETCYFWCDIPTGIDFPSYGALFGRCVGKNPLYRHIRL